MLDLQPVKDRLAAATPDHWRWDRTITGIDANGDEEWLILSQDQYTPDAALVGTACSQENAALMAHSREDLAALVAEVERLRAAIEAHREQSRKTYKVAQAWWDEDLWAVLDA